MSVYLDHFADAIGNPDNPRAMAQHYIGEATDVERRHREHLSGQGARIIAAAVERGITVTTVRVWEGKGRHFERRLKNRKNARELCPACNGDKALRLAAS